MNDGRLGEVIGLDNVLQQAAIGEDGDQQLRVIDFVNLLLGVGDGGDKPVLGSLLKIKVLVIGEIQLYRILNWQSVQSGVFFQNVVD